MPRARSEYWCCRCFRNIPAPPTPRHWTRWASALRAWRYVPQLHFLADYCGQDLYIEALAASVREHRNANGAGDHLLITFHGIPAQYVAEGDPYQRKCQATAQALVTKLGLTKASGR